MARIAKLALAVIALAAFGWTLTNLKPVPQGILVALPLLALLADVWARPQVKPIAFLMASSIATLLGFLFAGSTLAAIAEQQLFPRERRVMAVGPVIAGAAVSFGVFGMWFYWVLRPSAKNNRARRIGITALFATALLAFAIDSLVE